MDVPTGNTLSLKLTINPVNVRHREADPDDGVPPPHFPGASGSPVSERGQIRSQGPGSGPMLGERPELGHFRAVAAGIGWALIIIIGLEGREITGQWHDLTVIAAQIIGTG